MSASPITAEGTPRPSSGTAPALDAGADPRVEPAAVGGVSDEEATRDLAEGEALPGLSVAAPPPPTGGPGHIAAADGFRTEDVLERLPPTEAFKAYLEELRATDDLTDGVASAERVDLDTPLRAVIDADKRGLGRVTRVSPTSLWVESPAVLPAGTAVTVEIRLLGGHALDFPGTVVKRTEGGMGVRLETDETTRVFRVSFVELAHRPGTRRPEVRVRTRDTGDLDREQTAGLWDAWREAEHALHDDRRQQRFIQACLTARKLEFALDRYRAARVSHPGRPEPERYLAQIGKLIGFASLAPTDRDEVVARGQKLRAVALGLLVVLIGAVGAHWAGTSAARARPVISANGDVVVNPD